MALAGPIIDQIIAFLRSLPPGLFHALLFLGFVAEGTSLPFIHIPPLAMFLASAVLISPGKLSLLTTVLIATAGSTLGGLIAYRIGVKIAGHAQAGPVTTAILREERTWAREPHRLTMVQRWVERYGALLALASRWLGVLRPPALLATGMSRVNPYKVTLALALGSLSYCTFYQLLALQFQAVSLRLLRNTELELVLVSALILGLAWGASIYLLRRARS